ncbi:MAG: winged helix-turn-helix transcriptional regulator [Acidimicrobiales bacterium]|nr:winged helix-turn-helix transcriptional regulator [Acidimicrobiales bacterium]
MPEDARVLTETVIQLRRALRRGIRADIAWESLPMAQVELLQCLVETSPARVNDLADRLRLAQSTVSGLVGQMMSAGLVDREVDPADRRAAVVTVTVAGGRRLAEWEDAHVRRIGGALAELDPTDRTAISTALPALQRLTGILART